jgi:tetratricopeptide (TPR) repeat protein
MSVFKLLLSRIVAIVVLFCLLNARTAQSQSIQNYYDFIHKGETVFNQENYDEALQLYEQAFQQKQGLPFAYDLFHYGFIACKAGQYLKAEESFTKLIRLGLSPSYFDNFKDSPFGTFFQSERGKAFLQKAYQLPMFETINQELRENIFQRRQRDQYFRLKPNGYEIFRDSIIYVDHQNADFLMQLYHQYDGFPDESTLGIDSMNVVDPLYFILLFHQSFGTNSRKFDFSREIKEAITSGRLNNIMGGELLEKSLEKYPLGNDMLYTMVLDSLKTINIHNQYKRENFPDRDVCVGLKQKSDSEMVKINGNRAEIYLDNMQERMTKKELRDKRKGLPLWYFIEIIYAWTNEKDFEYACSRLVK